jgi:hypothetical protein
MAPRNARPLKMLQKGSVLRMVLRCLCIFGCALTGVAACLPASAQVVVFEDRGVAQVAPLVVPHDVLAEALPGALFRSTAELPEALSRSQTRLLVLPYGAVFPEECWKAISQFLDRGGNLLALGGRAFTRPAYLEDGQWRVRSETYAYARQLFISDYQPAGSSSGLRIEENRDAFEADPVVRFPDFQWKKAYSVVIRLSDEATSPRVGASGTPDSQLRTFVWGIQGEHKLAAPVIEVDHFRNHFVGGRWVMLNCDGVGGFASNEEERLLIAGLAQQALRGASRFMVTPSYPLYLGNERPEFHITWSQVAAPLRQAMLDLTVAHDGVKESESTVPLNVRAFPLEQQVPLSSVFKPGFYTVVAQIQCDGSPCGYYKTGFWVRDEGYLESGPRVTVDRNFFEVDGKPEMVIGTTYMASDAQRLFLRYPNPYVWDQDMQQIAATGMNMLRTGLWTDWDVATGDTGIATEHTLRTLEAFLMTARKYRLPVQFNLFAFMPEVFGGVNPYLDPEAVRREREYVESVVQPFAHVPFLMWDVINEPSFDNPSRFFNTKSNGDAAETGQWNQWLLRRYGSRGAIESAWKASFPDGPIPAPGDQDMTAQSVNDGGHPLAVYDFNLFAQESFAGWAQEMRAAIRDTGSQQLMTIGQDEGGNLLSPSPAFFKKAVDFSTVHSWWFNDDLLWDSLAARQEGLPMLVQETGVMAEFDPDGRPRRSLQADAALLEKKLGIAVGTGAGAIEWLWNINAVMRSQQEVTIGAVRKDGTEKPDAQVLEAYARFAQKLPSRLLSEPNSEEVTILTSQAAQYSVLESLAVDAQQRAVRVMNYQCHIPAKFVTENHVGDIAGSKLVVLPSAQTLQDATWQALMIYVEKGGNLLVTGPVDRDEHWQARDRLRQLGVDATSTAFDYRSTAIALGTKRIEASFATAAQRGLETLHLKDEQSYIEVKHGMGTIFIVAAPIELAESPDVATDVYQYVLSRVGIAPDFEAKQLPSDVLVRPEIFKDSVLYLFVSESSIDESIDIRDKLTGTNLKLELPASRTKLVLLDRATGTVIDAYNGPEWPLD